MVTTNGRQAGLGVRLPLTSIKRGTFFVPTQDRGGDWQNAKYASMSARRNSFTDLFASSHDQWSKRSISRR